MLSRSETQNDRDVRDVSSLARDDTDVVRIGLSYLVNNAVSRYKREVAYSSGSHKEAISGVSMSRRYDYLRSLTRNPLFDCDYLRLGGCYSLTEPSCRGLFAKMRSSSHTILLRGN